MVLAVVEDGNARALPGILRCESDRGGERREGGWENAKGPSTTLASEVFGTRHFSAMPELPSPLLPPFPLPSAGRKSVSAGLDGQSVNVRGREGKTKKKKAQTILEKMMQRERESMRQIPSLPEAGGGGGVLVSLVLWGASKPVGIWR